MVMNESEMTLSQRQADGADAGVTASPPREIAGNGPSAPPPRPWLRWVVLILVAAAAVWGWKHYRHPADAPASGEQQTARAGARRQARR